jgi:hypothetical protein
MKRSEYHGINIAELKPGDIITAEELVRLYELNVPIGSNHVRKQPMFAFLLCLKNDIEATLYDLGKFARCVQRRNDFHLIQSAAASEYGKEQFERAIGKAIKESVLINLVDTSEMSDDDKIRHIRVCHVMSEHVSAVNNIRDKLGMITGGKNAYAQLRSGEKIDWGE